jgi:ribose/xylose/arabinose/galactoside ABC-type transport system permease subunit
VAENVLPYLYGTFAVTFISGLLLFFYDPVHVGSHAYFVPKLLLLMLGLVVVSLYRRTRFGEAFLPGGAMPLSARLAGVASLLLWTGVVVCSCLNTEAAPKVVLY